MARWPEGVKAESSQRTAAWQTRSRADATPPARSRPGFAGLSVARSLHSSPQTGKDALIPEGETSARQLSSPPPRLRGVWDASSADAPVLTQSRANAGGAGTALWGPRTARALVPRPSPPRPPQVCVRARARAPRRPSPRPAPGPAPRLSARRAAGTLMSTCAGILPWVDSLARPSRRACPALR